MLALLIEIMIKSNKFHSRSLRSEQLYFQTATMFPSLFALRIFLFLQINSYMLNVAFAQKAFGESCVESDTCVGNLKCYNKLCGCLPENQIFTNSSYSYRYIPTDQGNVILNDTVPAGSCVSRIGHPCLPAEKYCVKGGICDHTRICRCAKYFEESPLTGECGSPHSYPCNKDEPCLDPLTCDDGSCKCPNKDFQIKDGKTCRGIVGTICQEKGVSCVKGAICQNSTKWGGLRCECGEGYIETKSYTCDLKFGASCDYEDQVEKCDTEAKLVCRNGVCGCPNQNEVYQIRNRARGCYRAVGYPCQKEYQCVANAVCDTAEINEKCQCRAPYRQTEDNSECVRE